jgi:hypothetical protein
MQRTLTRKLKLAGGRIFVKLHAGMSRGAAKDL